MKVALCWVAGILVFTCAALASESELTSDEIIANVVEAAGGASWKRPKTLKLKGDMKMYPSGLNDNALFVDDYTMWRSFPKASENAHAANGKVRFDAISSGNVVFQISFDGTYSYDRNGLIGESAAEKQWSAAFGFGIIRFADSPGFSTRRLADDQVEGFDCYFVEVTDPSNETTIFGIDKADYQIRMVGFDTPRGWHHRIYSDFAWHKDPSFRQPRRVRLYYNGRKTNDINWRQFWVNQPIDDEIFSLGDAK